MPSRKRHYVIGIAALLLIGGWRLCTYECAVCKPGTNLVVEFRGPGAIKECMEQFDSQGSFGADWVECPSGVQLRPVICSKKTPILKTTIRDQGIFGPGILGSILCEELASTPNAAAPRKKLKACRMRSRIITKISGNNNE